MSGNGEHLFLLSFGFFIPLLEAKLQVDLDNISLITTDCPGALPLADWARDPKKAEGAFSELLEGWDNQDARPVCQICDRCKSSGKMGVRVI